MLFPSSDGLERDKTPLDPCREPLHLMRDLFLMFVCYVKNWYRH